MICARNVLLQSKHTEQKHSGLRLVLNRNRSCAQIVFCVPTQKVWVQMSSVGRGSLSLVLWEV